VDVKKEHIAVSEAMKLNVPVFGIVDTNSDPTNIDFPIPANDDAFKSISLIVKEIANAVEEGLMERRKDKEEAKMQEEAEAKKREDEKAEKEKAEKEKVEREKSEKK